MERYLESVLAAFKNFKHMIMWKIKKCTFIGWTAWLLDKLLPRLHDFSQGDYLESRRNKLNIQSLNITITPNYALVWIMELNAACRKQLFTCQSLNNGLVQWRAGTSFGLEQHPLYYLFGSSNQLRPKSVVEVVMNHHFWCDIALILNKMLEKWSCKEENQNIQRITIYSWAQCF